MFFLLICGAYQLFGKYYKGVERNIIPGLEVFDYYTEANPDRKKRCIVNIVINAIFGSYLWGEVSNLTFEGVRDYFMYISLPKNIIFLIPQAILMFMFLKMIKPILKGRKIVPESLLGN